MEDKFPGVAEAPTTTTELKADPLAPWRGKLLELTPFEAEATERELGRINQAQARFLQQLAAQVLERVGVSKEARAGQVPIQVRMDQGKVRGFTILDQSSVPAPPAPATTPQGKVQKLLDRGKRPRSKPPAKAAT